MVEMKVLGSHEEWLRARTKIGGSDASAIVGMNPYKTNVDLFKEKAYGIEPEDISDKPYVKYGTAAEKHLRELFKLDYPQYQVGYVENNMFTNDKYQWAHASLDGWLLDPDGRKGVWECKTTNILQSRQKEKWDHRIPDNYYIQVLHYLMVTEFDFVVLKAQLKSEFNGDSPQQYMDKLREFDCVFTPDFSLYMDMPMPMNIWNVYRSRLIGQMMQDVGITVIPTLSWAEKETYSGWLFILWHKREYE